MVLLGVLVVAVCWIITERMPSGQTVCSGGPGMIACGVRRPFILLAFALAPAVLTAQADAPDAQGWLWRFVAGGATAGNGAFSTGGTFYFAAEDRYLYAVDRNGTMIWRTDVGRRPGGSVAVGADGAIVATLDNGDLLSLNPDGRLIWRANVTDGRPFAPVLLSNGVIVTVRRPSTLEARTHAGRQIWSVDIGAPVSAAPIAAGRGSLVVATAEGELVRVAVDGRVERRRYVGEVASQIVAGEEGIVLGSTNGRIVVVDSDLEPRWRADVGSAVRDVRVAATGDLYATSDDGALTRVTSEGVIAWRTQPASEAMRSVVVGEHVLAASGNGVLTRYGRDGGTIWQMILPDRPIEITSPPSGGVLVTTERWVTYAYDIAFEPSGAWPERRGGPGRRGVGPGAGSGRVALEAFAGSIDYLALRGLLFAGGQSEQAVAMAGIASRVERDANLAGEYPYLLALSEAVAGSPYFGQLARSGPKAAPRRAREQAIGVIAAIGDLESARFLARLLRYEPDPMMQAAVLDAMGELGTPIDEELARRLTQIVRRDVARGPSDALGLALSRFVEAIDAYRGGYVHPDIADTLLAVAQANYSRAVREGALATLRQLAGGRAP